MRRTFQVLVSLLILLPAALVLAEDADSTPPPAADIQTELEDAQKGKKKFPIGGIVALTQSIGGGTFTTDENVRRSAYDISLDMIPEWRITPMLKLAGRLIVTQAVVENFDSVVTYKNRTLLSDLQINLAHMQLYKIPKLDIGIDGKLGMILPTSPMSQYRGLYLGANARLGLYRSFGPVFLRYRFSFLKNFHRFTTAAIDTEEVGDYVVLSHFKGNEELTGSYIGTGVNNVSYGITNSLECYWSITDKLIFALVYAISNNWTYNSYEKDELASDNAEDGRGQRDLSQGVLELGYQFNKYLYVGLGTQTITAPKSDDNNSWVWPFMNFSNNHRQKSVVYLTIAGQF